MVEVVKIGKAAPDAEVVRVAEEILERARSGELRSIIWIADANGGWVSGFVGQHDVLQTVGQLARLQHRLQCDMDSVARRS